MRKLWTDEAWNEYVYWQTQDRKTLKRINELIKSIDRDGVNKGLGKPELLKYKKVYSRRIDEKNRIVYAVYENGDICIISCKGHYDE